MKVVLDSNTSVTCLGLTTPSCGATSILHDTDIVAISPMLTSKWLQRGTQLDQKIQMWRENSNVRGVYSRFTDAIDHWFPTLSVEKAINLSVQHKSTFLITIIWLNCSQLTDMGQQVVSSHCLTIKNHRPKKLGTSG